MVLSYVTHICHINQGIYLFFGNCTTLISAKEIEDSVPAVGFLTLVNELRWPILAVCNYITLKLSPIIISKPLPIITIKLSAIINGNINCKFQCITFCNYITVKLSPICQNKTIVLPDNAHFSFLLFEQHSPLHFHMIHRRRQPEQETWKKMSLQTMPKNIIIYPVSLDDLGSRYAT